MPHRMIHLSRMCGLVGRRRAAGGLPCWSGALVSQKGRFRGSLSTIDPTCLYIENVSSHRRANGIHSCGARQWAISGRELFNGTCVLATALAGVEGTGSQEAMQEAGLGEWE